MTLVVPEDDRLDPQVRICGGCEAVLDATVHESCENCGESPPHQLYHAISEEAS
jgi:hypothetical protein